MAPSRAELFLSTLSLRRATAFWMPVGRVTIFLSTLSLRRATLDPFVQFGRCQHFYPRSPCGERRGSQPYRKRTPVISIHALLAESDAFFCQLPGNTLISIHALLAESDSCTFLRATPDGNFYPRSPCGERQHDLEGAEMIENFYPRSPCGERLSTSGFSASIITFLSTLSLRRATLLPVMTDRNFIISIHALLAESDP